MNCVALLYPVNAIFRITSLPCPPKNTDTTATPASFRARVARKAGPFFKAYFSEKHGEALGMKIDASGSLTIEIVTER